VLDIALRQTPIPARVGEALTGATARTIKVKKDDQVLAKMTGR